MQEAQTYFSQRGQMSSPGKHAGLLKDLPSTISEIVRVVQGDNLHVFWAERYGYPFPPERQTEQQLRSMENRLGVLMQLDARPITEPRPVEKRLLGICRDFSLMFVMLLRQQGIPARARCGFATYFKNDHFMDHWVGEYWNEAEQRWILVDAQLDSFQCQQLKIQFNPLDVPRDQFLVGGRAWQMCRAGQANPDKFGIADMHGLWFVRGDYIRDIASLNKMELLPWDCWGLIEGDGDTISDADFQFLDELAELTCADVPDFARVRSLYEHDPRLRVPAEIRSYTPEGPQAIQLAAL
jgi:hypothetical protein